jgi:hypothetical protein
MFLECAWRQARKLWTLHSGLFFFQRIRGFTERLICTLSFPSILEAASN